MQSVDDFSGFAGKSVRFIYLSGQPFQKINLTPLSLIALFHVDDIEQLVAGDIPAKVFSVQLPDRIFVLVRVV